MIYPFVSQKDRQEMINNPNSERSIYLRKILDELKEEYKDIREFEKAKCAYRRSVKERIRTSSTLERICMFFDKFLRKFMK